jgi:hypothetical protein
MMMVLWGVPMAVAVACCTAALSSIAILPVKARDL